LKAANELYDLRLKPGAMIEIATAVGQDVPFFLRGGTARATGLGSTVAPLPSVPPKWTFLVICPAIQVSTRAVYDAVDGTKPSARRTTKLVELLNTPSPALPTGGREETHPPTRGREEGHPPTRGRVGQIFGNDLEPVSRKLFPALDAAIDRLHDLVPSLTMSGTGASMFAVFPSRRDAEAALIKVKPLGYAAWVGRPVPAS
jgi:4-diphosphocytidyl-2C-methyl-D-erythritol kinase